MRFAPLWVLFIMSACSGGQTLPAQSPASAPLAAVFQLLALDEMVRDAKLLFVDADGTSLRAVDVASGRELWRVPLGVRAQHALLLDLGNGRVMVQAARRFTTVRISDGGVIAQREAPVDWQFVHRSNGACFLSVPCGLQPIACEDGRPLGEALRGTITSLHGDGSNEFCASRFAIVGRAGDLSLYEVDATIVARDTSGATAWEREGAACRNCVTFLGSGAASDGSLCWTSEHAQAAIATRVFSCATGEPRFTHLTPMPSADRGVYGFLSAWVSEPPGIFVVTMDSASLVAPDGSERWTRNIASDTLAMPQGARLSSHPLAVERASFLATLDPHTGSTLRTDVIAPGDLRIVEGQLGVHPANATSDRGGAMVPAPRFFTFERDRNGSRALHGATVVLTLPGDGHLVGEVLTDTEALLVVAEVRSGDPDVLHVLRAPR